MPSRISHLKDGSLEHLSTDYPTAGCPCLSGRVGSYDTIEVPSGHNTERYMQQQALEVGVWQQEQS